MDRVLAELNNIWIGSFKIRAYLPRFERRPPEPGEGTSRSEGGDGKIDSHQLRQPKSFQIPQGRREAGRSFLDILTGKPKETDQGTLEPRSEEVLTFLPTEDEKEWLKGSFTGCLKSDFLWEEVHEEIKSECGNLMRVISMGGNLVHIQSLSHPNALDAIKGLDEWVSFWFEWLRPWEYFDVNAQRMVWTKWFGIPLHAWNPLFFELVGAKMGMVLKIHEDTRSRNRLDVALIQISTGLKNLDRIMECKINGAHFKIRIEEIGDPQMEANEPNDEDDFGSELGVDEEEEIFSAAPAEAQIMVEEEDGSSVDRDVEKGEHESRHRVFSKNPQSGADFSKFKDDALVGAPMQLLERQTLSLEIHAQKAGGDPLSEGVNLDLGLQSEDPSCKSFGPSSAGPKVLGPGCTEEAICSTQTEEDSLSYRPNPTINTISLTEEVIPKAHNCQETSVLSQRHLAVSEGNLLFSQRIGGYAQRRRVGRDFYLRGGCRRFLSQKCKRRGPKQHQRRGQSVDGRTSTHSYQVDVEVSNLSKSRDDCDIEVRSSPSIDPKFAEGLKIWDFGKKLGLTSSQKDERVAL